VAVLNAPLACCIKTNAWGMSCARGWWGQGLAEPASQPASWPTHTTGHCCRRAALVRQAGRQHCTTRQSVPGHRQPGHCLQQQQQQPASRTLPIAHIPAPRTSPHPPPPPPPPQAGPADATKSDPTKFSGKKSKAAAKKGPGATQWQILKQSGIPEEDIPSFRCVCGVGGRRDR
jgi:hypothetical protein